MINAEIDTYKNKGKVISFIPRKDLLKNRVKKDMLEMETEEEMITFMQVDLIKMRPELKIKRATVYYIYDHIQKKHFGHIQARSAGFPITAHSLCRRRCLIGLAMAFCTIDSDVEKRKCIQGIVPIDVDNLPEFKDTL